MKVVQFAVTPGETHPKEAAIVHAVSAAFPMLYGAMVQIEHCKCGTGDEPTHLRIVVEVAVSVWDLLTFMRQRDAIANAVAKEMGEPVAVFVKRMPRAMARRCRQVTDQIERAHAAGKVHELDPHTYQNLD